MSEQLKQKIEIPETEPSESFYEHLMRQQEFCRETGEFYSDAQIVGVMSPEYQEQLEDLGRKNGFMSLALRVHPDLTVEPLPGNTFHGVLKPDMYDYEVYNTLHPLALIIVRDALQDNPDIDWPLGMSMQIVTRELGNGTIHDAETPHTDAGLLHNPIKTYIASVGPSTRVWKGGPIPSELVDNRNGDGIAQTRRVLKLLKSVGAEEIEVPPGSIVAFEPGMTLHAAPGGQKKYKGITRTSINIDVERKAVDDLEKVMQEAPA